MDRQACFAINDLLKALLPAPTSKLLDSPHRRALVVQQVAQWTARGVALELLANWLAVTSKTLRRWTQRCATDGGGQSVPHQSRRPKTSSGQLPFVIQNALWKLRQLLPSISVAELARVFNRQFTALLGEHGLAAVSTKTVGRYVNRSRPTPPSGADAEPPRSPRGGYRYPPPLAMAWIDTTCLKVLGVQVHIIVALEASSRVALAGETFAQDNAAAAVDVLTQALTRVPELCAVLRDRGTPYCNAQVNALLADKQVLPIDAHPHFPLDKAALERFFGTCKDWINHALRPFVDRCQIEQRTPDQAELVTLVQAALRVYLRAYNLLPQAYLDDKSPIARIEALLRGDGDLAFALSDLRKLAIERETKDDLLLQVRDGLQIDRTLTEMRRDFFKVSREALVNTISVIANRLFITRDPKIDNPYGYTIAIAKAKERAHHDALARTRHLQRKEQDFRALETNTEATLCRERATLLERPEELLPDTLRDWVSAMAKPIPFVRRSATKLLGRVLTSLARKLGAAFDTQLDAISATVADLAQHHCHADPTLAPRLLLNLRELLDSVFHDTKELVATGPLCPSTPSFPTVQIRAAPT